MSKNKDYYVVYIEAKDGTLNIHGEMLTLYTGISDLIKLYMKEHKIRTVKCHIHNILNELLCENRQRALIKALKLKIISIDEVEG